MSTIEFDLSPFTPGSADVENAVTGVWNAACGPALSITRRFVAYNSTAATGAVQSGQVARQGDDTVGFVFVSTLPDNPTTSPSWLGWIDAIAVLPAARRRGLGTHLLTWAEDWLRAQGCTKVRLGGSLHPFVPGYPVELDDIGFFGRRGYSARAGSASVWDMARDLGDYRALYSAESLANVRPMQESDRAALRAFFQKEFPGRWRFEFEEFLRELGRDSDYMLLLTADGVDGFARLTFEDSERPIDRFYLHGFPRPWGQLGPVGVTKNVRGQGLGGLLLDRSLQRLHENGVRGCVIDWTDLVDLYGKFGFKPYREYMMLQKELA